MLPRHRAGWKHNPSGIRRLAWRGWVPERRARRNERWRPLAMRVPDYLPAHGVRRGDEGKRGRRSVVRNSVLAVFVGAAPQASSTVIGGRGNCAEPVAVDSQILDNYIDASSKVHPLFLFLLPPYFFSNSERESDSASLSFPFFLCVSASIGRQSREREREDPWSTRWLSGGTRKIRVTNLLMVRDGNRGAARGKRQRSSLSRYPPSLSPSPLPLLFVLQLEAPKTQRRPKQKPGYT